MAWDGDCSPKILMGRRSLKKVMAIDSAQNYMICFERRKACMIILINSENGERAFKSKQLNKLWYYYLKRPMKNLLALFILLIGSALLIPFGTAKTVKDAPTVAGKWHFVMMTEGGDRIMEPEFKQDGDQVTGKWGNDDVKGTFSDGKLNLEFRVTPEEHGPGTLKLKGSLADDALTGNWFFDEYSGEFKATRIKE
jgi:hypothetical protein